MLEEKTDAENIFVENGLGVLQGSLVSDSWRMDMLLLQSGHPTTLSCCPISDQIFPFTHPDRSRFHPACLPFLMHAINRSTTCVILL